MTDRLINARARARQYAELGLELPAEAVAAFDLDTAIGETVTADPLAGIDLDTATVDTIGAALREAALSAAVRDGMTGLRIDLSNSLGKRAASALAADLDRVTAELRPGVLEAAATVVAALAAGLDRDTYADPAKVITAGPAAAAVYHGAHAAAEHLSAVRRFLNSTSLPGHAAATFVTLTAEASTDTLDRAEAELTGPGDAARWFGLYALPGVAPALHTPEQAREVVQASARLRAEVEAERKAKDVEAARAQAEQWARLTRASV